MDNYEIKPTEAILFKGVGTSPNYKGMLQITLTNERIIIEKQKGVFNVRFEFLEKFPIENVKIYNNKIQVKKKFSSVDVQTLYKNVTINFYSCSEASKFVNEITSVITDTTFVQRNTAKLNNGFKLVDNVLGLDSKKIVRTVLEFVITGVVCNLVNKNKSIEK